VKSKSSVQKKFKSPLKLLPSVGSKRFVHALERVSSHSSNSNQFHNLRSVKLVSFVRAPSSVGILPDKELSARHQHDRKEWEGESRLEARGKEDNNSPRTKLSSAERAPNSVAIAPDKELESR
jgi:hypothetical protein